MTTLVLTNRPLITKSSGYDLRVWHLCRALAQHEQLVLLTSPDTQPAKANNGDIDPKEIFSEVFEMACIDNFKPSFKRFFRTSEAHYFSLGYPCYLQSVVQQMRTICNEYKVDQIIVFGSNLAGLVRPFAGEMKILLDVCDSVSLTLQRELAGSVGQSSLLDRCKKKLMLTRWEALEGQAPVWFDHVVTINAMDTEKIRALSGGGKNVVTLPNGVDPLLEHAYQESPRERRGVAFWGNLSFAPNKDALRFFYQEVYVPYLKPAAIEWCIVGRDAEPWLLEAAQQDENIRVTGFVHDLGEGLMDYPIMVNPMRIGSGMKNKVLEAYALGLAVVSTQLGIESIDGAVTGENYIRAESPHQFFEAILVLLENEKIRVGISRSARAILLEKYTWNLVGSQWINICSGVFPNVSVRNEGIVAM